MGCLGDLWGDKLLNSRPLRAQGGISPPGSPFQAYLGTLFEHFFDLEVALSRVFSHSRLDVAVSEVLVCKTVTKCANSEVVELLQVSQIMGRI